MALWMAMVIEIKSSLFVRNAWSSDMHFQFDMKALIKKIESHHYVFGNREYEGTYVHQYVKCICEYRLATGMRASLRICI